MSLVSYGDWISSKGNRNRTLAPVTSTLTQCESIDASLNSYSLGLLSTSATVDITNNISYWTNSWLLNRHPLYAQNFFFDVSVCSGWLGLEGNIRCWTNSYGWGTTDIVWVCVRTYTHQKVISENTSINPFFFSLYGTDHRKHLLRFEFILGLLSYRSRLNLYSWDFFLLILWD